jgi:hypothetical protein
VTIVDPAILNKPSETTGTSGSEEMKAVWLKVKWADNSRVSGWQVFRQFLQPYENPNTKQITTSLFICSNCTNLIRTLPAMVHDKTNVEDIDTKLEDHWPDAVRYWLKYLWAKKVGMWDIKTMNDAFNKRLEKEVSNVSWFLQNKPTIKKSSGGILTMEF